MGAALCVTPALAEDSVRLREHDGRTPDDRGVAWWHHMSTRIRQTDLRRHSRSAPALGAVEN